MATKTEIERLAVLESKIDNHTERLTSMDLKLDAMLIQMDKKYVSKAEFAPIKALVYGGTGLILIATLGGTIYLLTGVQLV